MGKINFQEAVVYEIHPQSFYDSNNDGVGDLVGIIKKLNYLAKLGVNYLWLNPIYVSPQKDNGYDVSDYRKINPVFGSMDDFKRLVKEAKKRDIYIMMDMIFNHCSTEHIWFKKATSGDLNYQDRFFFLKGNPPQLPTNWKSKFGGSSWAYNEQLKMFYLHLFDQTQADLNWRNEPLRQDIYKIVNYWLNKGVTGLRFDVINLIGKPKVFEDDLTGDGRKYYTDLASVHSYLHEMAQKIYRNNRATVTVGELSSTSVNQAARYTNPRAGELDMVFTFHHLKVDYQNNDKWSLAEYEPAKLIAIIQEWQEQIQTQGGWLANFLNNHDQPRALSRFGDPKNYRFESATALAAVVLLLRGTPFLFQGEEFGMENNDYKSIQQLRDVESINYYQILQQEGYSAHDILKIFSARSRDNARTPMQWSSQTYGGFSKHQPWIELNTNYHEINWANDYHSKKSIFKTYQKLIKLRQKNPAFIYGKIEFVSINPVVLSFYRIHHEQKFLVVINLSKQLISIEQQLTNFRLVYNNYETFLNQLQPFQTLVFDCTKPKINKAK